MRQIISKKTLFKNGELFLIFLFLGFCNQVFGETWAERMLGQMSLQEKIGQLFVIPACQFREDEHIQDLEFLIGVCGVGGVILKQGTADGQAELINRLQGIAKTPLLCVQDAEWGLQMRMADILSFPKNLTLGAIQNNALLYRLGQEIGWHCSLVGGHINTAPVIDVNSNPHNTLIHSRSFGEDPQAVAEKGMQMMLGMQSAGVIACPKHFPGHGDAAIDSHLDLPLVLQPIQRLQAVELFPFKALIEAGVKAIMTAHVSVPALCGSGNYPTTFSSEIIQGLLCRALHFEGLVISDALNMQALTRYFDDEEIAERAFISGHDLLLYGDHLAPQIDQILREQIPVALRHLVGLFEQGKLDLKELDRRVLKILQVKEDLNLDQRRFLDSPGNLKEMINRSEAYALKRLLYREAVTLLRNQDQLLPLKKEPILVIEQGNANFFRERLAKDCAVDALNVDSGSLVLQGRGLVVFALTGLSLCKENFDIKPPILEWMEQCRQEKIPFAIVLFSTPYSLEALPLADAMIVAYESDPDAQEAAAEVMLGELDARGRLPISVLPHYPVASGL